jgi:hypothetical protein
LKNFSEISSVLDVKCEYISGEILGTSLQLFLNFIGIFMVRPNGCEGDPTWITAARVIFF